MGDPTPVSRALTLSMFEDIDESGGQSASENGIPGEWEIRMATPDFSLVASGETEATYAGAKDTARIFQNQEYSFNLHSRQPLTQGWALFNAAWSDEVSSAPVVRAAFWNSVSFGPVTTNASYFSMSSDWIDGAVRIIGDHFAMVVGNQFDNVIISQTMSASLDGKGGNDTIAGGVAADSISGGSGDDQIWGNDGSDIISGDDGNDTVFGGAGSDFIAGSNGDDILYGGDKHDMISGGESNDSIRGGNDEDTLLGDLGRDIIFGDDGNDLIVASGKIPSDRTITYSEFEGNPSDLFGDYLSGGLGNDTIIGSRFADTIFGGAGNDLIYTKGNDSVKAGSGDDVINNSGGMSRIYGDGGDDEFRDGSSSGRTWFDGGADDDVFWGNMQSSVAYDLVSGGLGNDILIGGAGADTLYGDDGNDTLMVEYSIYSPVTSAIGGNRLYGGEGNDSLTGGNVVRDRLDTLYGGNGDDVIVLNASGGKAYGDAGNDTIFGSSSASSSDCYIFGNAGNDRIVFGSSKTIASGGIGADVFVFNAKAQDDASTVVDFNRKQGDRLDSGSTDSYMDLWGDYRADGDFDNLSVSYENGNSVISFDYGDGSRTMTLQGVDAREINLSWFVDYDFIV